VEVTAQVEDAQAAHAVPAKTWLISQDGAPSTIGIKLAANASSHTRVEETPTPCFTTPTTLMMLVSGKSTKSTGDNATEEAPHVPFKTISTVPSRSTDGEETPGNSGVPTLLVDADYS
jgi:hypothetical protein